MAQPQEQGNWFSPRESFTVASLLTNVHAWCFWPFLHRNLGCRTPGILGFGAFLLIAVVAGISNDQAMQVYLAVWFIALVRCTVEARILRARGMKIHSHYRGDPFWGLQFPFIRNVRQGWTFEAVVCFAAGILLLDVSQALGSFVAMGGFSMLVVRCMDDMMWRQQEIAYDDAMIDMQIQADRMRGRRYDY